jgi:predicted ArsR family transcriptional regulator
MTHEKILKYINEHTGPFKTKQIADYFLISENTVLKTMRELENEKQIRRTRVKNTIYWHKTLNTFAMALPSKTVAVRQPAHVGRWSVYDDRSYD